MNENLKTLTFVIIAAAVALVAWASKPSLPTSADEDLLNKPLNPDFANPLDAASLEIVKYDEAKGTLTPFKVAEVVYKGKTRWSIPSHDDYPADAKNQMASAGAALCGLTIIKKVSDNKGDQAEYGVVDPDPKELRLGASGVGDRVIMRDKDSKQLLGLVVGKPVPDRPDLRYVRKIGDSAIYIVEAKTDKLSAKFEDWIEPNLLQINTMDLKDLLIRDYAIRASQRGMGIEYRGRMQIAYNDAEPHWTMVNDEKFTLGGTKDAQAKWEPVKMAADQELNAAKLDELKTALDDLKIVDVSRKPAGLSSDLKVAADFATNDAAVESLQDKGFFPAQLEEKGPAELFSNEGEIRLVMKNGVEYVLRFGQITDTASTAKDAKKKDKAKDAKKDKDKTGPGLNRYLFVMAEFNPSAIPKPKILPLPEPAKAKEPEKKPVEEKKPDAAKPADAKPDEKKPDAKKPDEKKADEKADEKKPEPKKPTEAETKALEAERAAVEKDNKRKQEDYERLIADGKKRVAELNTRFADWYYVISDDVYRKIHLGRDELIVKKSKKKEPPKGPEGMIPGQPPADINVPDAPMSEPSKLKQEGPGAK